MLHHKWTILHTSQSSLKFSSFYDSKFYLFLSELRREIAEEMIDQKKERGEFQSYISS